MTRLRVFFLIATIFLVFPSHKAFAPCVGTTQTASTTSDLDYKTLQIPGGSTTYGIDYAGGADTGTGTRLYGGASAIYQHKIKRLASEAGCSTFSINVTNASCGSGCSLGSWAGSWDGVALSGNPPWTGLATLPAAGGKTLKLGATATYDGTVTAGSRVLSFDVVTQYDAVPTTTLSATGAIGFDSALTIDNVVDIDFKAVKAMTSGTYTMATTGVVTPTAGGVLIYGTTVAGSMKIHGSSTQTISISAGSYVASAHVTLSAAKCAYNGGGEANCSLTNQAAPTAAGKTLLIGVKAVTTNSAAAGTAEAPSFTITVTYS